MTAETETTVDPETGEETVTVVTPLEDVLAGLSIMPPADSSDDFTLWVGGQNANGGPIGDASMVNMVVTGVADTANLEVGDVVGPEDTWIPLDVSAALTDPDGSETLSISIEGIPKGEGFNSPDTFSQFQFKTSNDPNAEWIVVSLDEDSPNTFNLMGQSDENPDGYTAAEMTVILETLQIKAPFNHDEDFDLTFTATVTEDDGDSLVEKMVSTVNVMPRADEPNLQLEGTEILADNQIVQLTDNLEDTPISLNILPESTDPSEVLSLTIGDIPLGAVIKVGRLFGEGEEQQLIEIELPVIDNTVSIPMEFRDSITITPPPNSNEDFQLTVTATSTEPEAEFQLTAIDNNEGDGINAFDGMAGATEVTISGFPEGSTLSAGTDNGDGTWTISANHADALADILANVTLTVPEGTDEDFALQVTGVDATDGALGPNTTEVAVEDVSVANLTGILDIQVTGDADEVDIQINDVTGDEDTAIPLNIDAQLQDLEETLSITISDVPPGAVLSAGNLNPDGSYTLTPDQLANLTITPAPDSNVDFDLTVSVTSIDGIDTATVTDTLHVDVIGVADDPNLTTQDVTGQENAVIPLDITSSLNDTDGSETLSITIANVPAGALLSAGINNNDGTWTLTPDQLGGLTITPPLNSEEDFTLQVTATTVENDGDTATVSGIINVDIEGIADAPVLNIGDAQGLEDTAIPLNIDAQLADADEVLSVTISAIPPGSVLMSGTTEITITNGSASLTQEQLADLTITPPADSNLDMNLQVTATATQGGTTATTTDTLYVDVVGVADAPNLATEDATGDENEGIPLDTSTNLTDTDGSESLSITIGNIPDGASLNKGTLNADGTYTLTPAQLFGLEVTPPNDFEGTFTLFVTSTSTENDGDQANTFDVLNVNVEGGADTPVLVIGNAAGLEDNAIPLDIDASLTDLTETLSVTIAGVPDGATLSAGAYNQQTGEWVLTPQELNGLSITPPEDSNVDFNLTVTATSTNGNGDIAETSGNLHVAVQSVADDPTLSTQDAVGADRPRRFGDPVIDHIRCPARGQPVGRCLYGQRHLGA